MSFVSIESYPVIYVNMPKAACSTIKNYLYFIQNKEWYEDSLEIHWASKGMLNSDYHREELLNTKKNAFCFTFVRHPLKRAYSCYLEKIVEISHYSFENVREILIKDFSVSFASEKSIEREKNNFKQFLKFVLKTKLKEYDYDCDYHWAPQSLILKRFHDNVRMTEFIGKVESFKSDFQYVLKKLNYKQDFPHKRFNVNQSENFKLSDLIDDEILELSFSMYAEDYSNFSYDEN